MKYPLNTIVVIMVVFLIAGFIKGMVGLGLPPIVLGILTTLIGIHPAMAMVSLPAFTTNLVQAFAGKHGRELYKEYGWFFGSATLSIAIGSWLSLKVNANYASLLLGCLLCLYGVSGLINFRLRIKSQWEPGLGITFGALNGIFTGLTGSSAVPGLFYLQSVELSKDKFIQAMGILFTGSSIGLSIGLIYQNVLTLSASFLSGAALLPAFAGMALGGVVRKHISTHAFQRIFFISIALLGSYIVKHHIK